MVAIGELTNPVAYFTIGQPGDAQTRPLGCARAQRPCERALRSATGLVVMLRPEARITGWPRHSYLENSMRPGWARRPIARGEGENVHCPESGPQPTAAVRWVHHIMD